MGTGGIDPRQTGNVQRGAPQALEQSSTDGGGAKKARLDPYPDGYKLLAAPPKRLALPAPPPEQAATMVDAAPARPTFEKPILLYNGDCATCRTIAGWVQRETAKRGPEWDELVEMPIGNDPDAVAKLHPDLDIWAAYETVHVLMPDGSIKAGGEAVAEVLKHMPTTKWMTGPLELSLFGWRPFQSLVNGGYWFLDNIRPALGCESCSKPPPWWGMPIKWTVDGIKWVAKQFKGEQPKDPPPAG